MEFRQAEQLSHQKNLQRGKLISRKYSSSCKSFHYGGCVFALDGGNTERK
jgi:hypothetical protein